MVGATFHTGQCASQNSIWPMTVSGRMARGAPWEWYGVCGTEDRTRVVRRFSAVLLLAWLNPLGSL